MNFVKFSLIAYLRMISAFYELFTHYLLNCGHFSLSRTEACKGHYVCLQLVFVTNVMDLILCNLY